MGKLRLLFVKEGRAVYISHLDLLRTFQRVFLRQGLVLRHSQGFHPHPILSFALPLPVGQASDCELLDFETAADMDGGDLPERLNRFMPAGIRALPSLPRYTPAALSFKIASSQRLPWVSEKVPAGAAERIEALLTGESLVIQKRTKRKAMADIDIRPMLHSLSLSEEPGILRLHAAVSAQNPGMNPALLAAAVERHLPELRPDFVQVRRLELLDGAGGVFR